MNKKIDAHLLDSNGGLPRLFFIQNRETDGSRWINVGMEKWWGEFAYERSENEASWHKKEHTLWWLGGVILC